MKSEKKKVDLKLTMTQELTRKETEIIFTEEISYIDDGSGTVEHVQLEVYIANDAAADGHEKTTGNNVDVPEGHLSGAELHDVRGEGTQGPSVCSENAHELVEDQPQRVGCKRGRSRACSPSVQRADGVVQGNEEATVRQSGGGTLSVDDDVKREGDLVCPSPPVFPSTLSLVPEERAVVHEGDRIDRPETRVDADAGAAVADEGETEAAFPDKE